MVVTKVLKIALGTCRIRPTVSRPTTHMLCYLSNS